MPESSESDHLTERVVALPATDETYTNAITVAGEPGITAAGMVGFHIDAQTRNALRQAFTAGKVKGKDEAAYEYAAFEETGEPDFDEWLEQYIEDHERITSD